MANIDQLSYCTTETNVISALPDKPNAVGGLTASQLKAKFDAAAAGIKSYLNDTLVKFMNEKIVTVLNALATTSDALVEAKHTHANKALLDSYAQDSTPTAGSANCVTSGGLYTAVPKVAASSGVAVGSGYDDTGKLTYTLSADKETVVTSVNGQTGDVTGAQAVAGAEISPASVNVGGVAWMARKNDGGYLVANNAGGVAAAEMYSTEDRRGVVSVNNAEGALAVRLYAENNKAGGAVIRNAAGANIINLISSLSGFQAQSGAIMLRSANGSGRAALGTNTSDNGVLTLTDASGNAYTLTPALIQKLINL